MKPEMGVSNEGNDKTKHLEYLRKIFIKSHKQCIPKEMVQN